MTRSLVWTRATRPRTAPQARDVGAPGFSPVKVGHKRFWGFSPGRGVMSTRTKRTLFLGAYVYVLIQLFAMLVTTVAVVELGAPGTVQAAAMFASFFVGVATVIVMLLRPIVERELVGERSVATPIISRGAVVVPIRKARVGL